MEYPVGVEMSNTYLSFEVTSAALKLVRDFMLVKEGENVVITADTSADFRVVEAVAGAAYSVGANPVIIHYPTSGKAYEEPIRPVADAVVHADVWIELAYYCSMHTPCFRKAMENGARFTCLNGMDVIMLVNTVGRVDYDVLIEFGEYLTDKVHRSNEVIVTDKNGTNLVGYNQGRGVKHSGQRATKKGYPVMLGGQVSWCPVEETINGKLIFDSALFPPDTLGLLNSNVELTLEKGVVTKIEGGKDAAIFEKWLNKFNDPNMFRLAHYSIGFNPGVTKPTGRIVEDERLFGCIEMGIGSQGASLMGACWDAAAHTDGIVSKPTILLDDAKGAYLLTKYLIDTGHRQIAGVFKADDSQGAERHKGYVKALQEAGMSYQPELVVWFHTEDRKVKPAVMVQMMLEAELPIDAVVCYNDQIAVEVIRMLERIGKKVPEDLSVTGYDDSMIARTGPVELTTVSHPQEKLGEMAAELLLELLHGVPPEESRVLRLIEPELVIRKSCMERR